MNSQLQAILKRRLRVTTSSEERKEDQKEKEKQNQKQKDVDKENAENKDKKPTKDEFEENRKKIRSFFQQKNSNKEQTQNKKQEFKPNSQGFQNAKKLLQHLIFAQNKQKPSQQTQNLSLLPPLPPPIPPNILSTAITQLIPPPPPPSPLINLPMPTLPPPLIFSPQKNSDCQMPIVLPPPPSLATKIQTEKVQFPPLNLPPPPPPPLPISQPILFVPQKPQTRTASVALSVYTYGQPPPLPSVPINPILLPVPSKNGFVREISGNSFSSAQSGQIQVDNQTIKLPKPIENLKENIKEEEVKNLQTEERFKKVKKAILSISHLFFQADLANYIIRQFIRQNQILPIIGTKVQTTQQIFGFPSIQNKMRIVDPITTLYADSKNLDVVPCFMGKNLSIQKKHSESREVFLNCFNNYNWENDRLKLKLIKDSGDCVPKEFRYRQINFVQVKNALNRCEYLIKSYKQYENFEGCVEVKKLREDLEKFVAIYIKKPEENDNLFERIEERIQKIKDCKM